VADIFEQMKQGAELLILMDLVAESGIPFTLTHTGEIYGEWRWASTDGVRWTKGDSALTVMRSALGMIAKERDGFYDRLRSQAVPVQGGD